MGMDSFYLGAAYVLAAVLGLCVGSFLNVVIYRVPAGMSLATPSSHCPKCKYVLRWYDNIPVLSYLMLGGKCRSCRAKISFRYTAVEIANMLLWLLSAVLFWQQSIVYAVIAALASSVFVCVFFIDLEHKLVFDRFVLILIALGIVAAIFDPYYSALSHIIGGVGGFAAFYLIAWLFETLRHKDGLGGGDIKLTGACGLLLGWQRLMLSVLCAAVVASVVLIILSRRSGEEDKEYPFAPFLTCGFALAMFFGHSIISGYLSLLGI